MTNDEGMTKSGARDAPADDSFWDDGTGLVREEPETKRVYDLEERTARFGEAIIDFAKTIQQIAMRTSKAREARYLRHSGFIILSSFDRI
jgi:hypothetical protein